MAEGKSLFAQIMDGQGTELLFFFLLLVVILCNCCNYRC